MRFRPGPITEASAIFAIAFLLSLITFVVIWRDFQLGFSNAFLAVLLTFMPSYTLTAIITYFVRYRASTYKFWADSAAIAFVAISTSMLTVFSMTPATSAADMATLAWTIATFAITSLLAAAFTQFYLIDNDGLRLSFRPGSNTKTSSEEPKLSKEQQLALTKPNAAKKKRR